MSFKCIFKNNGASKFPTKAPRNTDKQQEKNNMITSISPSPGMSVISSIEVNEEENVKETIIKTNMINVKSKILGITYFKYFFLISVLGIVACSIKAMIQVITYNKNYYGLNDVHINS